MKHSVENNETEEEMMNYVENTWIEFEEKAI
jgi:hypothetical protein